MATMHTLRTDQVIVEGHDLTPMNHEPMLFHKLRLWADLIPENFADPIKQKRFSRDVRTKDELLEDITLLEKMLVPLDSPVVFSHNDIRVSNLIYNSEQDKTSLIDAEYAAYNYQAFDLGEFIEFTVPENVDYQSEGNKQYQMSWLRCYLENKNILDNRSDGDVTDEEVYELYVQAKKFGLAGFFFWGMWALMQAKYTSIDFDYIDYAVKCFDRYYERKDEYVNLKRTQNETQESAPQ